MKIVCDACSAKYTIPDHKLKAKQNKVRCKKCGHTIVFSADGGGAAPAPEAAPVETVTTPGAQWFAAVNNKETGPLTKEELFALVSSGQVDQETLVWREGMADWIRLADVAELDDRPYTGGTAAFGALPEPPAAPAANATIALSGIDDLLPPETGFTGDSATVSDPAESEQPAFGDSAVAEALATGMSSGPTEESSSGDAGERPSSAAAPVFADFFAPASQSRLTGAGKMVAERSEDSVLFSLATLTQSTPAVKAGAAANDASGLIDIRVLASAAAPAAAGRAPVASIAAPVIPLPPRKKNTGLVVGAAAAGAVVVAIAAAVAVVATRPAPKEAPPAAPATVAAAPEAAPAPAPAPVPEVAPAPAVPEEPPVAAGSEVAAVEPQPGTAVAPRAPRPASGAAPSPAEPPPAAALPEAAPAPVAAPEPVKPAPKAPDAAVAGVLSSLRGGPKPAAPAAAPAAPAPAPEAPPAAAAPKGLTKDEVRSTIARYGSRIARCKTAENAGTTVKVSFTIDPSGSVSGASSADGGEAGSCLAGVVSGMKFKAFEGAALPITFPFKL